MLYPVNNNITYLDLGCELRFSNTEEKNKVFEQIYKYKKLKTLLLDFNELKQYPCDIFSLLKLEKLSLANNSLTSIPEHIGYLTNLKELYLQSNLLTSIPDSICNLKNLRQLHLADNKLTSLPKHLDKLTQLEEISIISNSLTNIPKNISTNKIWLFVMSSYQINNLSPDCEYLTIYYLDRKLDNLPIGLKELRLYSPIYRSENMQLDNIKLPFGCCLYIDDKVQSTS